MPECLWEGFFSNAQLSRWYKAMPLRFACRKFSAPADVAQQSALAYTAARVSLPGVRLALLDCDWNKLFFPLPFVPAIEYARQYAAVIIDLETENVLLNAGVCAEALVLEMTSQGLGSCWVQANFRRSEVDIPLSSREKILAVIPYGHASTDENVSARKRKPLKSLCLDTPDTWPNWAFQAAEAVRSAPSALNSQPWRFSYSGNTLRLSGRGFGNVNFGIAALHIECALHELQHQWRFSTDGKGLLISIKEET
ncbi:MAG: hypothetical protein GX781_02945 [Clostridiales bacterium]|nr:hypothetical protein [Clostridiales bacterium]